MKLLFIHQFFGDFGGAEVNVRLTGGELQRRGHEVALVYRHRTGNGEGEWGETFPRSFCLPTEGNLEMLKAAVQAFGPDLIYLHNLADLEVLAALRGFGVPVVRLVHDHSLYCLRGYKYNYFTRRPCQRAASGYCVFPCLGSIRRNRGAGWPLKIVSFARKQREIELNRRLDHVVVYSEYVKRELVRNGFAPGKIDVLVPMRIPRVSPGVSSFNDRNRVLYAGQIIRGKGVDVLLRALAKVNARFECALLGSGTHLAYCQRLSRRLGLEDRVRFQGYVPPDQLEGYYLEASLFVMSSLWPEPFGMAGPEAMGYGLPVVAFDVGGIGEWLRDGENGFLVPWKDTSRFAARVEQLLTDKELARRLGQRARDSVQPYDYVRQIAGLEALFGRLIQAARTPAHGAGSPVRTTVSL